jgi:hypothetical protein
MIRFELELRTFFALKFRVRSWFDAIESNHEKFEKMTKKLKTAELSKQNRIEFK